MIIKSKKFILRPYRKGDEKSLRENINDRHIYRYTCRIRYPYKIEYARQWVKYCANEVKKKAPKEFVLAIDVDGKVVGNVGFQKIENHKAEIGYWIGKKFWNRGIMTEAVRIMTFIGFKKLNLRRIYAPVFSKNKASARVLEKNKYKFEGLMRNYHIKDGKLIDALLYAKTK